MALRHLCNARPTNPNRHDNLELVITMPEASSLSPNKFTTNHKSRIKDVANDVFKHISQIIASLSGRPCQSSGCDKEAGLAIFFDRDHHVIEVASSECIA
ncbi:hypothetical protein ROLI_044780 [Roseobacter fucihabitans]|uniref:Uncharacterized protein n=1 Tax=Roseobacter fucihabitans TaxID=1537242 RepID=A0ABZ2BZX8_9RHOB|nr:hypothetical protein [Roseobacter litoralis]